MNTFIRRVLVSSAVISALGGCARSLVYDESRDKQGQEAKRAASALKIVDSVRALEKGYADVAKLEVESAKSLAETLRNKELAGVARAKVLRGADDGLLKVLESRMRELGAKPREPAADGPTDGAPRRDCGELDCGALMIAQAAPALLRTRRNAFELSRAEFRALFGHDFKTCTEVRAAGDDDKASVVLKDAFAKKFATAAQRTGARAETYYADLKSKCADIEKAEARLSTALVGNDPESIRAVVALAEHVERDVADYRVKLVLAQGQLAAAAKSYADTEKALAQARQSRLQGLEARMTKLKGVVENIRKGADALGTAGVFGNAGSHAAANELVSKLETVLGAVTGQQSAADQLDSDDRAAVAVVRAIPELADEADKVLKEAGKARLVPFAIAREHLRLEAKGFEDEITIKIRRMEAQRARSDAMTQELAALARVHYLLSHDKSEWASQPLAALAAAGDAKDRQRLYEALAIYWDEVFLQRSAEQIWKARAEALRYDEGLARSTAAALQWDNLIGGVGTVLADYHAAGVKPAEIAEFLKAFGLIYIGARVGR